MARHTQQEAMAVPTDSPTEMSEGEILQVFESLHISTPEERDRVLGTAFEPGSPNRVVIEPRIDHSTQPLHASEHEVRTDS